MAKKPQPSESQPQPEPEAQPVEPQPAEAQPAEPQTESSSPPWITVHQQLPSQINYGASEVAAGALPQQHQSDDDEPVAQEPAEPGAEEAEAAQEADADKE
jgi:hypothetical protein